METRQQFMLALARREKEKFRRPLWWHCFNPAPEWYNFHPHETRALYFLSVEKPIELAQILQISFFELEKLINNPGYHHFSRPKKRGGRREIYEPTGILKKTQKRLNYLLQACYLSIRPAEAHGFVINPRYFEKSCNIVENAKVHVGRKHLLNMDLEDFFPSITALRVRDLFLSNYFGFNGQLATALALLTTYSGRLPIGAPSSPVISNFICLDLDKEMAAYCRDNHISYSRYADDLSFSSAKPFTNAETLAITAIIEKHHFKVNQRKTRMSGSNRKQTVTGLVVNSKVNVDRRLIKRVRAMLHHCKHKGISDAALKHYGQLNGNASKMTKRFKNRLLGYVDFIGQVKGREDPVYLKLANEFKAITLKRQT